MWTFLFFFKTLPPFLFNENTIRGCKTFFLKQVLPLFTVLKEGCNPVSFRLNINVPRLCVSKQLILLDHVYVKVESAGEKVTKD